MNEIELIIDLHKKNKRQWPWSQHDTERAFSLTWFSRDCPIRILDIWCGTGAQTITLAQFCNCEITAVDLSPDFLSELQKKAVLLGLNDKIFPCICSMADLPFSKESFDLIRAEGAIYNMGFETGLQYWKDFLKPGWYLCVSDLSWTTDSRPIEIEAYWQNIYSEVDTLVCKQQILEDNGYVDVASFLLSPNSWLESYYDPLQSCFSGFLQDHHFSRLL